MQIAPQRTVARPTWKEWILFFLSWSALGWVLTLVPLGVVLLARPETATLALDQPLALPGMLVDVLATVAVGGIAMGGLVSLFLVERVGRPAISMLRTPEQGFWRPLWIGILAIVIIQIGWGVVQGLLVKLGMEWAAPPGNQVKVLSEITGAARGGLVQKGMLLLMVGLIIPMAEELIFRGAIFGGLRLRFRFVVAALLSSAIFGLAHGVATAVPTGLMGLLFAWMLERHKSLYLPIALHALNNVAAVMLLFLAG